MYVLSYFPVEVLSVYFAVVAVVAVVGKGLCGWDGFRSDGIIRGFF